MQFTMGNVWGKSSSKMVPDVRHYVDKRRDKCIGCKFLERRGNAVYYGKYIGKNIIENGTRC